MSGQRYIRQIQLKDFGKEAQKKLSVAKVLVVGVGGLGIPVLQYLNAMGVGTLGLIDQDVVELHNLQRQVLFTEHDIGRPKLEVALERLQLQNSNTTFQGYDAFLTRHNALEILASYDVIVDATDNFATRYLINDACLILNKPFVYGALHGYEGHLSIFNYEGGPTYRCLFPEIPSEKQIPDCNSHGVLGIIPGIIGSLQALETVKIITGIGEVNSGKLLIYNGLTQEIKQFSFKRNSGMARVSSLLEDYGVDPCGITTGITVEELHELITRPVPISIVDVRSRAEFNEYHLAGAINIPLDEIEGHLQEIQGKEPIYLICQTGKRSSRALKQLQAVLPGNQLYNIQGGMEAYSLMSS